jgi:tetratricopeptide (TPR) repeat protein
VAFSPDGRRLACGSLDETVVLDLATGRPERTLRHTGPVHSVAFSPDGRRLVGFLVTSVAFSPDGRRLASGSGDGTAAVWDLATGQRERTLGGHTGPVRSVAFSPDGRRLASGSGDGTAAVWDLATGQPARTLRHTGVVYSVAFSPDGRRLACGSDGGTVVWETSSQHLWHLREAIAAEEDRQWATAAWFLEACRHREIALRAAEALSGASSPVPLGAATTFLALRQREGRTELADLLERHHRACLELGRWDEAEADFRQFRVVQGDTPGLWQRRALGTLYQARQREVLLAASVSAAAVQPFAFVPWSGALPLWPRGADTKTFRRTCDEMAKRFPEPKDAATAHDLARTRLLVGDGLDAAQQAALVKLAKFAVDRKPDNWSYRETYGAALYRAGDFAQAIDELQIAVKRYTEFQITLNRFGGQGTVWQQTFLAMAYHRLGKEKEARDWLTRAVRQIEQEEKERPGFEARTQWHYLRQEAEATLGWRVPPQTAGR